MISEETKPKTTFRELGLDERVQKALAENGFEVPFPIQEAAIPLILQGKDVVGQAHTGTGKTAAFGLPLLTKIREGGGPIQALVLVPTRELAVQVTNEINKFSKYTGIRTVTIYGGQSFGLQKDALRRGSQIIVATPGRLIDHLKRRSIRLDAVRFAVLDEADRMLDMGFIEDIKFILSGIDKRRQTCLFSATMPPEILRLARDYMKRGEDLREIRLNRQEVTIDSIEQSYLIVSEQDKLKHLVDFLRSHEQQTIVFTATKRRADRLASELKRQGVRAVAIHGDLSQGQRDSVMHRFRRGADNILVATDIAARGIDVPAVGQVINYDVPLEPDTYFHRIGRTARAGGEGKAISLVSPDRINDFGRILRQTRLPISRLNELMGIAVPAAVQHQRRKQQFHRQQQRRAHGSSHGGSRGKSWRHNRK